MSPISVGYTVFLVPVDSVKHRIRQATYRVNLSNRPFSSHRRHHCGTARHPWALVLLASTGPPLKPPLRTQSQ
ncbi:hypothetical protein [Liquorilactobacillus nagelii]|uniref:hypothetical protein n=1 Tax=Liquorilactobacillus nagelii TaxID=82688 RepID=UPI00138F80ED|nr:hypothetical protein [Liquorilactobacillus nagelii]QYH55530.1 hypothetical protein G6O73_12570 [Liquorilactobacillus nagelii DSM 13675]